MDDWTADVEQVSQGRDESENFEFCQRLEMDSDVSHSEGQTDREKLNKIFSDFNRIASALDESYQILEARVSSLKKELSETRLARRWDLAEKDRLANRLASLVSALPNGVLVINKNGLIIDRNPLASQVLSEPLIGLTWQQVLEREGIEDVSPQNEIYLADGRVFSVAQGDLAVSKDSAIFLSDVTEIHSTQNELARSKRLKAMGEMAASMAHQIRTPLSSAHLYMSPLARADITPEERISTVTKVQNRLSHMGKLIDSMLGFARGTKNEMSPIELEKILEMVRHLVSKQVEEFTAELVIPPVDRSLLIKADAEALVGALANLVLNALEMAEQPPKIIFDVLVDSAKGAKNQSGLVEIRVRDNGPGIDPEKLDRIFDPFFTTRSTGTGLGLAIVAMTCKEHGGSIHAINLLDGGAEFVIRLPVQFSIEQGIVIDGDASEVNTPALINGPQQEVA